MATTAELERLDALVKRLTPLSQTARGELIRADDWNSIVLAVVELARAVYSESQPATVPAHNHFDEVSLAWLDKRLRTLVSGGVLKDPLQEGKLNSVERKLTQLNRDLSTGKEDSNRALKELDLIVTRELARENQVQRLDRQVSGLKSASDEVGALRLTLAGINQQIATVQTIADQLRSPDGQIVDVAQLQKQVSVLNDMREQFRDANGEVISGISIDQKIAAALNTLVTEEELIAVVEDRLGGLDSRIDSTIRTQLSASLDQAISGTLNDFRDQLRRENNQLFEGLDATISTAVADQLPAISAAISNDFQAQIKVSLRELQGTLSREITQSAQNLREELVKADAVLRDQINADIDTKLKDLNDRRTIAINESVSGLRRDMEAEIRQNNNKLAATMSNDIKVAVDRRFNERDGRIRGGVISAPEARLSPGTALDAGGSAASPSEADNRPSTGDDDFFRIRGISAPVSQRLLEASIHSFAELAAMTPAAVAEVTGLPANRVKELELIGQAQRLSEEQS